MRVKKVLFFGSIFLLTLCVGCQKKHNEKIIDNASYTNFRECEFSDTDDYYIYNVVGKPIYCENKKTHKCDEIYKDLYDKHTDENNMVVYGNNVYYMLDTDGTQCINKIGLDSGESECVYKTKSRLDTPRFLGKTLWRNIKNWDDYVDDRINSFLIMGNRVVSVDNKKEKVLFYDEVDSLTYCNDIMYYINFESEIYKYDFKNNKLGQIKGVFCNIIEALPEGYVYTDELKNCDIYYDNGSKNFICSGENLISLTTHLDGYIYILLNDKVLEYNCKEKKTKELCKLNSEIADMDLSDLYVTKDKELYVKICDEEDKFMKIDY